MDTYLVGVMVMINLMPDGCHLGKDGDISNRGDII